MYIDVYKYQYVLLHVSIFICIYLFITFLNLRLYYIEYNLLIKTYELLKDIRIATVMLLRQHINNLIES